MSPIFIYLALPLWRLFVLPCLEFLSFHRYHHIIISTNGLRTSQAPRHAPKASTQLPPSQRSSWNSLQSRRRLELWVPILDLGVCKLFDPSELYIYPVLPRYNITYIIPQASRVRKLLSMAIAATLQGKGKKEPASSARLPRICCDWPVALSFSFVSETFVLFLIITGMKM